MPNVLGRKNYARITDVHTLPTLIEVQLESFRWLLEEGLAELFNEISPIESFNGALKLYFPSDTEEARQFELNYWFDEPKYDEEECLERDMTYASPLYVKVALVNTQVTSVV